MQLPFGNRWSCRRNPHPHYARAKHPNSILCLRKIDEKDKAYRLEHLVAGGTWSQQRRMQSGIESGLRMTTAALAVYVENREAMMEARAVTMKDARIVDYAVGL